MNGNMARRDHSDVWFGIFWISLGASIIAYSLSLPLPRHLGASVLTGPGLVPGLLGALLTVLGGVLFLRGLFTTDSSSSGAQASGTVAEETAGSNGRALLALVLMFAYATALVLQYPFLVSTLLFITLFVTLFNWSGRNFRARVRLLLGAAALGLAVGLTVEYLFETLFYVRLP